MNFLSINKNNYNEFIEYLKSISDEKYREFHSKLVPNTNLKFIGVRLPIMRKIAKEILKGDYLEFLEVCKSTYYEEVMLRGLVTAQIKGDFEDTAKRVDEFLPYVDNWAVCDTFCNTLKGIKKFLPQFFEHIKGYMQSDNPWTLRVGFVLMMTYYISDEYIDTALDFCERVKSEHYYVQMGKAWLMATAYAKHPDKTKQFLLLAEIDDKTFNMTIQKCMDSFRISKEDKIFLKTLKR